MLLLQSTKNVFFLSFSTDCWSCTWVQGHHFRSCWPGQDWPETRLLEGLLRVLREWPPQAGWWFCRVLQTRDDIVLQKMPELAEGWADGTPPPRIQLSHGCIVGPTTAAASTNTTLAASTNTTNTTLAASTNTTNTTLGAQTWAYGVGTVVAAACDIASTARNPACPSRASRVWSSSRSHFGQHLLHGFWNKARSTRRLPGSSSSTDSSSPDESCCAASCNASSYRTISPLWCLAGHIRIAAGAIGGSERGYPHAQCDDPLLRHIRHPKLSCDPNVSNRHPNPFKYFNPNPFSVSWGDPKKPYCECIQKSCFRGSECHPKPFWGCNPKGYSDKGQESDGLQIRTWKVGSVFEGCWNFSLTFLFNCGGWNDL